MSHLVLIFATGSEIRTLFEDIVKALIITLPGHSLSLQISTSVEFPSQLLPPYIGLGLLHSLVRFFNPSPHVFEQSLQLPHKPQFPFTEMRSRVS